MIEKQSNIYGIVVVAQLAEWSLQIQEVCGSNHEKIFIPNMFTINCQKDENKEKRGQEWTTFKKETSPELECLTYLVINNYHNWILRGANDESFLENIWTKGQREAVTIFYS